MISNSVDLGDPLELEIGEITLRSRQRLRSSDPSALRAMRRTALSKSMRWVWFNWLFLALHIQHILLATKCYLYVNVLGEKHKVNFELV